MSKQLHIMVIFGTRPEAIKMAPVVLEMQKRPEEFNVEVITTAQHRQMLDQVLNVFHIKPSVDLNIMKENQTLSDISLLTLERLQDVFKKNKPDMVLVHGDTTTTFVASLCAFYHRIPIGHVEAGLRTWDKNSPFPEEVNRQLTGVLADLHFAPTELAATNLRNEGKQQHSIFVTGNTAIDALKYTVQKDYFHPILEKIGTDRIVLLTAHRRENLGEPLRNIFRAVKRIVQEFKDVQVVYPIHLNPLIRKIAEEEIGTNPRIHIIEPLDVIDFHNLAAKSVLILTDSGGVQEEAPSLGVPVLVLREHTERPEGVSAGTLFLVGTNENNIYEKTKTFLLQQKEDFSIKNIQNPYGDGLASLRILEHIRAFFGQS